MSSLAPSAPKPRHKGIENLRPFDSERAKAAAAASHAKRREKAEAAERAAVELAAEKFQRELLKSIDTWQIVRDDPSQPGSTRIQAADRFVDRALGPVGQKVEITDASAPWAELTPDAKRAVLAQLRASLEPPSGTEHT